LCGDDDGLIGAIMYLVLNVAFQVYLGSAAIFDFIGVIVFPVLFIVTEALKFCKRFERLRKGE
jgi:lipopolysaccharide export LptBFGC system permease protein LptF